MVESNETRRIASLGPIPEGGKVNVFKRQHAADESPTDAARHDGRAHGNGSATAPANSRSGQVWLEV